MGYRVVPLGHVPLRKTPRAIVGHREMAISAQSQDEARQNSAYRERCMGRTGLKPVFLVHAVNTVTIEPHEALRDRLRHLPHPH